MNDGEILLIAKGLPREPSELLKGIKTPLALDVARQGKP